MKELLFGQNKKDISPPYIVANVFFLCERSIEETAEIISNKLLGGVPFIGKEQFIYDEVPAVFAKELLLGFRIVLQGFGGQEGYILEIYPDEFPSENTSLKEMSKDEIDITQYVKFVLKDVILLKICDE